jgi:hypothetical protein
MKARIFMAAAMTAAMFFSACKNDDASKNTPVRGDESTVRLTIVNGTRTSTRGTTDTQAPTDVENALGQTVDVYVFDASGAFETSATGLTITAGATSSDPYVSDAFKVTSGDKYFYVFANASGITAPTKGMNRTVWEQAVQDVTFTGNVPNIATNNAFLIGTLWGSTTNVAGTGTPDTPESISLSIGRVASKVNMKSITNAPVDGSGLKGDFDTATAIYRLGSVPVKYYTVGQWSNAMPPANGSVVTSAVDNAAAGATNYKDYTWPTVSNIGTVDTVTPFYAIENTNKAGQITYGTTTYMQLKIKYTPDASELLKADGTTGGTLAADGTFYTAKKEGVTYIFAATPDTDAGKAGFDLTTIKEYKGGINYYHTPIMDATAGDTMAAQCVVLRNHYYELNVTSIARLGDVDDTVDPDEPIKDKTDLTLSVTVLPWSKIVQNVDL